MLCKVLCYDTQGAAEASYLCWHMQPWMNSEKEQKLVFYEVGLSWSLLLEIEVGFFFFYQYSVLFTEVSSFCSLQNCWNPSVELLPTKTIWVFFPVVLTHGNIYKQVARRCHMCLNLGAYYNFSMSRWSSTFIFPIQGEENFTLKIYPGSPIEFYSWKFW